ncbi:MAG: histidinol dehydrogenase [Actinobacteria bacterium]|nr:MAG: histidinol dehydrogenase [Actinomycetota bacterium]
MTEITETVTRIITDVAERGDTAVRDWSARLDRWERDSFRLDESEIRRIVESVPASVIEDIRFSQGQVRRFAEAQRATLGDVEVETLPGVTLGHRTLPIASAGSYVPGGRYPMVASAHMSIVTAKVAGVERVAASTPPLAGKLPAATIAAMHLAGADELYCLGGVQAIAALALGTETIAAVDFIAGPGNTYVVEAKRQLFGRVGIDLLAGPTEIVVVADETADAELVAADLLGQAEHGPASPAILVTTSPQLARDVEREIARQLETLPTADVASAAWRDRGEIRVVADDDEALGETDALAFEHVEVHTRDPDWYLARLRNYGSLFLGETTTVAYGDKTTGTNHILPTGRAARYSGGLWVGKYLKTVTYQRATREASVAIGEICARQCRVENFEAHARSCDLRIERWRSH